MPITTGVGLAIGGGLSAAGSVASGVLGASAAQSAASTQAQASEEAAQLQFEEAQQALGFEEQQYANTLGLQEPGYLSGNAALGTLDQLLGLPSFAPDTNIFSNPFGMGGAPTGVSPNGTITQAPVQNGSGPGGAASSLPAAAQGPLAVAMNASSGVGLANPFTANPLAQSTSPLSSLGASPQSAAQGAQGLAPLSSLSSLSSLLNPQQQAAAIEGFGNLPANAQTGPVFANGQGPTTIPQAGASFPGTPTPAASPTTAAAGTIGNTGLPAGFLAQTWNTPFVAPTADQAAQMPGYQFQLQQGEQAIQNSAAARGGLLSGGTAKALDQYSQGLASTDYQQLYNQALTQYQQAYNIFNQNQANIFNRYADLAGMGQVSAQQLSNAGLSTGSNVGNTLLASGAQIGGDLQNAAAAEASGYVGAANAYGGALGSLGSLGSLIPLYNLLGQGQGSGSASGLPNGNPSICWIAEVLYGKDDIRTHLVRKWLKEEFSKSLIGRLLVGLYEKYGQRAAQLLKRLPPARALFRPVFDRALSNAIAFYGARAVTAKTTPVDYERMRYQIG